MGDFEDKTTRIPTMTCFSKSGAIRRDLPTPLVVALFIKEFIVWVGVALHEIAHEVVILSYGLEVKDSSYFNFRWDNIWGYIDIQTPRTFKESFFVFTAPFYLNTIVSAILFLWLAMNGITPNTIAESTVFEAMVVWFALSVSIKSIPSPEDVQYIGMYEEGNPDFHELQEVIVTPFVLLFRFMSRLPLYFLDVVYAFLVWGLIATLV